MFGHNASTRVRVGAQCTFADPVAETLADASGTVIEIWPRLRSGDYLVTLEYAQPIKVGKELISHIDAFVSELRCELRKPHRQ